MNSLKDFRGKIEPPVEKEVLKIERYAQRLTQGYSAYGGSHLWAPDRTSCLEECFFHLSRKLGFVVLADTILYSSTQRRQAGEVGRQYVTSGAYHLIGSWLRIFGVVFPVEDENVLCNCF